MRRWPIALAVLATCCAAWVCDSTTHTIWVGQYELTVRVSSKSKLPQSVTCQAFGRRGDAERAARYGLPSDGTGWPAVADPFDGKPLAVRVMPSGRDSMIGRELVRTQSGYLAVVAVMPDGRRVVKIVDIPDDQASREVDVVLP